MSVTTVHRMKLGLALGLAVAAAFLLAFIVDHHTAESGPRRLSSLGPAKSPFGFAQGKAHQGLRVRISNLDEVTGDANAHIRLLARIQLSKEADGQGGMGYTWNLPASVTMVSGSLQGMIPKLSVGEVWEQEVVVTGLSLDGENQRIKLDVAARMQGQLVSDQAFFVTRPMQRDLTRPRFEAKKGESWMQKTSSLTSDGEEAAPPKGIHF